MPKKTPKKDWSAVNQKIANRKNKFTADERIFKPTYNDKNQAKVTMRFLDSIDTDVPYVDVKSHFFNDVGGWFIETCPNTIGKECPVCADLSRTYKVDKDEYESIKNRKKTTTYYTNALIIDDQNKPENNGKVVLFKFGSKIMEKIDDINSEGKFPWDENVGVNFIFSAKKKSGNAMPNYDASRFTDEETELSSYGDEDEILAKRHKLSELNSESSIKSYAELQKKYEKVIGKDEDGDSKPSTKPSRTKKPSYDEDEDEGEIIDDNDNIGDEDMLSEGDDDDFFDDLDDDE